MNIDSERRDLSAENAALRRRVAALQAQVDALADANAVAAELMADLEEARAVEAALRRRGEELGIQRSIDQILVGSHDAEGLASALLRALIGATALELEGDALLLIGAGDGLRELASNGDPGGCRAHLDACRRLLESASPGEWHADGRVLAVLRASDRRVGVLCVRGRPGLDWRDRWLGLLLSVGAQIGVAIERLLVEARNHRLVVELAEARDRALAATRAKDHFLATMSHELRTPLNAIIGYGELLLDENDDAPALAGDLQRIVGSGKHLLTLVNDVLDLAKIEAGKIELCRDRFTVAAAIHDLAEMILPLVEANQSALQLTIDDRAGEMETDLGKLRQILLNLLSNAAKFTHGGVVHLIVSAAADDDEVVFIVADSGIGMTTEQLARVFDPFVQADATTTRRYGGTGLGLTICGHFAGLLGGTITVDSAPGQGSSFELVIPRRPQGASQTKPATAS